MARKTQEYPTLEMALWRIVPQWISPRYLEGRTWKRVVRSQMAALICRDTLIMEILGLRWSIRARDQERKTELQDAIDHYTEIFLQGDDWGYDILIDRLMQDMLDIPFGGLLETERADTTEFDERGDLVWLYNVDGTTLSPTPSYDVPVVQNMNIGAMNPIFLRRDQCQRCFLTPRTSIERRGYGMAPPEKIYLALQLLARGDRYYANLLLDTPPPGILDLLDIDQESAKEWVGSFRELMVGSEAFKIPVLYEHEKAATWIPFTKSPSELLFDSTTLKYTALTTAGYGITLRDIGIGDPQRTMASQIRESVQSRRHGFGTSVAKIKYMFDRILPPVLEWRFWVDDAETLVARGRARLSMARGYREMEQGPFSGQEVRLQAIDDGFVTIDIDPEWEEPEQPGQQIPEYAQEHHVQGNPVPPSQGGEGELRNS